VAGYSAVIDVRVQGQQDLRALTDGVGRLNDLIRKVKPVPTLFDKRGTDEVKQAKQELAELVKQYANGNTVSAKFSTSIAGVTQQLGAFNAIAANAKTGSEQFTNALKAAANASANLLEQELERFSVLQNIYQRQPTQRLSAQDQGPSKLVRDLIALKDTVPNSVSALERYQRELLDVQNAVSMTSIEYRELAQTIRQVDVLLGKGGQFGPAAPPVQGPALPPNFNLRKTKSTGTTTGNLNFNPNATAENMALGAGFPLLFGGGAGQVAGGLIGSFFGSGFGGQILGSAIGQILEDAQRRITEIGNALDMLDMDKLRESVVFVNAELETTVRRLIEAGDAQTAQAIAAEAVAAQTGMVPAAVDNITSGVNILGNTWNQFLGAVSGLLSLIGAPFVSALTVLLSGFTKILQYANLLGSTIRAWGVTLANRVLDKFPILRRFLDNTLNGVKAITEEEEKRNAALQAVIDKQDREIRNSTTNLALEKQRTLGRTTAEKLINIELDRGLEINRINAEYEEKILQFRRDNAGASTALVEKGVRQIQVAQALAIEQVRIKTLLQEQGLAMDAINERYARAAEAIRRQQTALETSNNVRQSQLSAESALNDLYGAQLERQYQLATTSTQRYNIAIAQFQQQVRAAQIEYVQSKLNNQLLIQRAVIEARLAELQYRKYAAQKQLAILDAQQNGATAARVSEISAGYDALLGTQRDVVQVAYDQVTAAKQIAANQDIIARAVYQTKIVQLEGALAQKLTSAEIGMSKDQADKLAGALGVVAFQAVNTKDESSRLVGVIQVGTSETRLFASAMSDVATYAKVAADDIGRAFRNQQLLNSARGARTTTAKKAADGAFWAGGFKAFAKGGVVNRPTLGLIGEGGESEYIVPESKAAGFATSYLFGKRGEDAIPSEGSGTGAPPLTINVTTGPVMEFDGQRYVTVTDMERAMRLTAEGVIGRLRTPSARIALGMAR
jgi:hypothetical protein